MAKTFTLKKKAKPSSPTVTAKATPGSKVGPINVTVSVKPVEMSLLVFTQRRDAKSPHLWFQAMNPDNTPIVFTDVLHANAIIENMAKSTTVLRYRLVTLLKEW